MPKLFRDDEGVSPIVAALLLILITVIAAAGLAIIVSQAEKNYADRQTLQNAVNNEKLDIVTISPHYLYNYTSGNWYIDLINVSVHNVNIDESNIMAISVNDVFLNNYTSNNIVYDYTNRLHIPASINSTITLNMSNFVNGVKYLDPTKPITVRITTGYVNNFERTYKPPIANPKFSVESESLGTVQRDYIMLDGSDSSSETGQIIYYNWTIHDGSNITYLYTLDPINTSSKIVRFDPPTDGPFTISLTVTDNIGLIGNSNELNIPTDPNFIPPFSLMAVYDKQNARITATLNDSKNKGYSNAWVNFQPTSSNITVWPTGNNTDNNGNVTTNVNFYGGTTSGNVLVSYGKISFNIHVESTAPSADFTANVDSGTTPLSVQFNDNSSGVVNTWQWDFGDGTNSISQNPAHTFPSNPGPNNATYTVKLTVSNSGGSNSTQKDIIVVPQRPMPSFNVDKTSGNSPLNVVFTDTSTGNPDSWQWDFGDGTTSTFENPPSHQYNNLAPGKTYNVTLTASNAGGSNTIIRYNYITINPMPPVAAFTSDKTSGQPPLTVQFTDISTGPVTGWQWDFGDGSPNATIATPTHTYTILGNYTVTLTVSNDGGSNTTIKYIQINPPPPSSSFTSDKTSGQTPLTVQFTDLSTGGPTGWQWDFGDGSSSTAQNPIHTFPPNSGPDNASYIIKLTVTNAGGSTTSQKLIMVNPLPPVALFTADKTSGSSPLTVQFTDGSTGPIKSYLWNFSDGSTSTAKNPIHTFPTNSGPGNIIYLVKLTVFNAGGSSDYSMNITVNFP